MDILKKLKSPAMRLYSWDADEGKIFDECIVEIERLREIIANLLGQLHGQPIKHPQQSEWRDKARSALQQKDDE